jgi:hypothetical protein
VVHLSLQDLVAVWEQGQDHSPVERALDILAVAWPHTPRRELASLPLGQRDAELLRVREATLGWALAGYAACPSCGERLEFELDTRELRSEADGGDPSAERHLDGDGYTVRFRLPTSLDLTAAPRDPVMARVSVLERCVRAWSAEGLPVAVSALPDSVLEAVEREMAASDPAADPAVGLSCPACAHAWSLPLDIAAFFWTELVRRARRLLYEVHTLARAYGWTEADILAMSTVRRRAYLELLA